MVTLESLYQRYGPERLPEDMERRDDLRPGDNGDDDDDDDDDDHDDDDDTGAGDSYFRQVVPCQLVSNTNTYPVDTVHTSIRTSLSYTPKNLNVQTMQSTIADFAPGVCN